MSIFVTFIQSEYPCVFWLIFMPWRLTEQAVFFVSPINTRFNVFSKL